MNQFRVNWSKNGAKEEKQKQQVVRKGRKIGAQGHESCLEKYEKSEPRAQGRKIGVQGRTWKKIKIKTFF